MADPYSFYRAGPNYPLPYQIEGAPLELYRTHAHQARPDVLTQGLERFLGHPNGGNAWLPQTMGQTQWKRGPDGHFQRWDASARGYLTAVATAVRPPVRGGSTARVGRIAPQPQSERYAAFDAFARQTMQRGAWRADGGGYGPPGSGASFVTPSPALSRNIPPPQLLPSDLHALLVYEEAAIGAAQRSRAASVRSAINSIRAQDAALARLMGRR